MVLIEAGTASQLNKSTRTQQHYPYRVLRIPSEIARNSMLSHQIRSTKQFQQIYAENAGVDSGDVI
jgi:hypothetical protein